MKIKTIKIKSSENFFKDLHTVARALDRGLAVPKDVKGGEYFESLDAVRNMLTEGRLELWRAIRDRRPRSISEAAKLVGRGFRAVHRDLRILEACGLISLRKTKGKRGDLQTPVSLADRLHVAVA